MGTWRVVIKAPILVLDIYWQAGKPLRIMTFANGDWQQELSHLAGDARKEKHCTTDRRGSTIMPRIRTLPENPTLMDLRAKYASLFELLRPYGQQLMRGPSPLTPGQRELIAAYTSATNACRYCHGVHTLVAEGFGVDPAVLDKLWTDIGSAPVEERMKPLLSYARKLTEAPSQESDADADAVYTAGWSEEALVHTIAVCAYFNQMNRLVEGAGIVGSPERYAANAKTLVALGYQR